MRVIADLHIHGRFSRGTSQKMNIDELTRFAQIKGIDVVGTGDFTHPRWLEELKRDLVEIQEMSLCKPAKNPASPVHYMITGEVSTVFTFENKVKKIHHLILTPNIETAVQVNERLARYGNLAVDGRPRLDMTAPQLVEEMMQISSENVVIPAHVWTPWFSLFGAFSGFDHVESCYQDMTKHISAIETGLSSDPPMNWRLSMLDKYALISNSDSHSHWPWRMGREANVFELTSLTYHEVIDAIRQKDPKRFKFTIETIPDYGKYHWTGHRNCKVTFSPQEAVKFGNHCPVCRRSLTKGVAQRVEELADRSAEFKPSGKIGYVRLLPLSEIIGAVLGVTYPGTQRVWGIYSSLVARFGNEYDVLIDAPEEELSGVVNLEIAEAIVRVREGKVKVIPGYDGVYGEIIIFPEQKEAISRREKIDQRNLADFM